MNLIRNNIKKDFTTIPNDLINDNELSDRARFLFCYMAAKPDDWKFYQNKISKDLKLSIDTVRKYLEELINSGWIGRELCRGEAGKFDSFNYTLNSQPCRNFPDTVKNGHGILPTRENSVLTKERLTQKNTITKNNLESIVEQSSTSFLQPDEIEEIEQQIYTSKMNKEKERKTVAPKKKEKGDNPAPITPMWEAYLEQYARTGKEAPVFLPRYAKDLKMLFSILRTRAIDRGELPLDSVEPFRAYCTAVADYILFGRDKNGFIGRNFNPGYLHTGFNTIISSLQEKPQQAETKGNAWAEWAKRQNL